MYALPAEPTAIDIIKRSIDMHPSLFTEALKARQEEDALYAAGRVHEKTIYSAVRASVKAATNALSYVDNENADAFEKDMAAGIIALNIACKLQCIPAHVRTAAALRTWPQE